MGISIGSGEWLIGPRVYVAYGLLMLWIATVSIILQTLMNIEFGRYTVATGEPITTGMMRLPPGPKFWGPLVAIVGILHVVWPGWAAAGATAIAAAQLGRLPGPAEKGLVIAWAIVTFILCMLWLLYGKKIELTLERIFWFTVFIQVAVIGGFAVAYVPLEKWVEGALGFVNFGYIPPGADWLALGALAGYAGLGGFYNTAISNYYRDKGYGMGAKVGYISGVIRGVPVRFTGVGKLFKPTDENLKRWKTWFRFVQVDQWGVFCVGAFIGMLFPALLYVTYVKEPLAGWKVAAMLAEGMAKAIHWVFWPVLLAYSFFLLFDTQVGVVETIVRQCTDMLWFGSERARKFFNEDIRRPYYVFIAILWIWGLIVLATGLARPMILLMIGAWIANLAFAIACIGTLLTNRKFLPKEVRPGVGRQVALIIGMLFFGFFFFNTLLYQLGLPHL